MSPFFPSPGAQQQGLAAYLDNLAGAVGHADRAAPLESYCSGLLFPGERGSVEPKLKEFLMFVLSRQGQKILMLNGKYEPLPKSALEEQRVKLP